LKKNIIFDLGGVLLNLYLPRTHAAFEALVGDTKIHNALYMSLLEHRFFEKFEVGALSEAEFVETMRSQQPEKISAQDIRQAWSAMLGEFPKARLEFLKNLRQQGFRLYLLSNINEIHLRDVYKIIETSLGLSSRDFDALFDKAYYSHLIQKRKPVLETFEFVLQDAGISAKETIFVDDTAENVEAARKVGIDALLHPANGNIQENLETFLKSCQIQISFEKF
jgi:glucose-1-phosphatase